MVNSSFFVDGGVYDTADVTSSDNPASTTPSQAPSSFYPSGEQYGEADITLATEAVTAAQAAADAAAASAANAAAAVASAAGTATPIIDGTAAVGTSPKWAHEDHVHPTDTSRADAAATAAALALKAPLASPALTGTPTAPTPTNGDSSTKIATTAWVQTNAPSVPPATVAPLMDGTAAVGATTKYAREDHVHPTDTSRAPLASPAFTGTPTAPTPTAGDSSTRLATTAWVQSNVASVPGGRLTPSPGVFTPTTDFAAATSVYYGPAVHHYVPIYNGTSVKAYRFTASDTDTTGLTLTLGSNWAAATIYELFVTAKAGVPTLVTGPGWTSPAAGASVRGYSLALFAGVLTNAATMTVRDTNSSTFSVGANQATYVGLMFINGVGGQYDLKFGGAAAGGSNAINGIWNAYNRTLGSFEVFDTTATWNVSTLSTWQTLNGSTGNRMSFFTGLADDPVDSQLFCTVAPPTSKTGKIALGLSSTTTPASRSVVFAVGNTSGSGSARARVFGSPGNNYIQALQFSDDATTVFATGSPSQQGLIVSWWW